MGWSGHALERIKERYDLELETSDLVLMAQRIKEGHESCVLLRVDRKNHWHVAIRYLDQWLYVVYNSYPPKIFTFMPRAKLIPYRKPLKWFSRELRKETVKPANSI